MTTASIERLIACQDALMQAMDARDVGAIEGATQALAEAVAAMQGAAGRCRSDDASGLEHALKQSDGLRIRTNLLADWTRQRIDRLAELRGDSPVQVYARSGKSTRL